jgi:hypothetical protein
MSVVCSRRVSTWFVLGILMDDALFLLYAIKNLIPLTIPKLLIAFNKLLAITFKYLIEGNKHQGQILPV